MYKGERKLKRKNIKTRKQVKISENVLKRKKAEDKNERRKSGSEEVRGRILKRESM